MHGSIGHLLVILFSRFPPNTRLASMCQLVPQLIPGTQVREDFRWAKTGSRAFGSDVLVINAVVLAFPLVDEWRKDSSRIQGRCSLSDGIIVESGDTEMRVLGNCRTDAVSMPALGWPIGRGAAAYHRTKSEEV